MIKMGSNLMIKMSMSVLAAGLIALPSMGFANDFSTLTRVHYVQDCVALNAGKMNVYESSYKCSCVVDELAKSFTQVEFEDINTGFRFKNLPGDRGGVFRDDQAVKGGIKSFQQVQVDAFEECRIKR